MFYLCNMIDRDIEPKILDLAEKMPVISITGPRQSGKTTLAKKLFPEYKYINFEDIEKREFAKDDPKGFLNSCGKRVIFDEIQNVPELFSYIQVYVDNDSNYQYIITGSQNFLLLQKISQSLAGRVAIFHLLPFSINELKNTIFTYQDFHKYIIKGGYPRIYNKNLNYWNKLSGNEPEDSFLIYGGTNNQKRNTGNVISWNNIQLVFEKV